MSTRIEEIAAGHAAQRYAEALATAAAADEKITALTEAVKVAEYHRNLAEMQLSAADWPESIGQVIHVGTDAPDNQVEAIVDLYSGQAWARHRVGGRVVEGQWVQADRAGLTTVYEWPIADAGPFIKLKDSWFLTSVVRDLQNLHKSDDAIHDFLRSKTGYRPDNESGWIRPESAESVARVVSHLEREYAKVGDELWEAKNELKQATKELEALRAESEAVPA